MSLFSLYLTAPSAGYISIMVLARGNDFEKKKRVECAVFYLLFFFSLCS